MTAIWHSDGTTWRLLDPTGFADEAALHNLVEEAPQLLPLAGEPQLVVVGREVQLGNGYADLLAVEPSGRLVVVEVKLARNAEARRAVVAQVLTYAAYLRGLDPATLEQQVLGRHLAQRGYQSLADAVAANDQEGAFEPATFAASLAESLD
jgi:RecB family endonuclease NucS